MRSMNDRFAVIMAGGRGERFWPQSRNARPKHLQPIVGDTSLLAQTIERLQGLVPMENIIILTNRQQREGVRECCPDIPEAQIVCEPVGRDTAPAVGLAMLLVEQRNPEATFAMLPADHVIHDHVGFRKVLGNAYEAAERQEALVTIGIRPTDPATGYGYIHRGEARDSAGGQTVYAVNAFVEKPDIETARTYLDTGEYYWNAGMFVWSVKSVRDGLAAHAPTLNVGLNDMREALKTGKTLEAVLEEHFSELEKISIDYALMEKASNVLTLESAFDWDDVGAWPAIANHFPKDAAGNVALGKHLLQDAKDNIVFSKDGTRLTALLGVKDLIVVHTPETTLICPKERAQDIKQLVRELAGDPEMTKYL